MKYNRILAILVISLALLIPFASASECPIFTADGDSWTCMNTTYFVRMWNATGNHQWLSTGNTTSVEYFIVAGGGHGGDSYGGGGGGAGGSKNATSKAVTGLIGVVVGAGGTGATGNGSVSRFDDIIALGGGMGGDSAPATTGGSGGGGFGAGTTIAGAAGTLGQGYGGGYGAYPTSPYGGGGGGGFSGNGTATMSNGGDGGPGVTSGITGINVGYAGGGGGGVFNTGINGTAVVGYGGGDGGKTSGGIHARANSGGGGGGSGNGGTNLGGDGGSGIVVIKYNLAGVADFTANRTYGAAPLLVGFTDISSGTPTSWNWSFGDGTYSELRNASHTYAANGNYTVNLTANTTLWSNTMSKTNYINVGWTVAPVASFAANATEGNKPFVVQFTDSSTNNPTSWLWKFGDGNTSTSQNPVFTYNIPGTYTVNLTATNPVGNSTETKTAYIVVHPAGYPLVDFYGSPTSGSPGALVHFYDTSVVSNTTGLIYNWSFGDGSYSSTIGDVQHVYAYSSVYDVNLTITNAVGTNYELKQQYITISTSQQTTWYTPAQVELTTVNEFGNGIPGVLVSGTPVNFTAPDNWAEILIGIQPTVNMSGTTIYGFTGSDGSWSAPVLQSYRYHWTFVNGSDGINQEATFYPTDPTYRIWITTGTQQNYTYSQVASTNLTFTQPDAGNMTLGMNYYDSSGLTYMVNFTVYDYQNDTVYYTQSTTGLALGSMVTSSYTLPNIRGNEYVWKYQAYRTDGSVLAQGNSVMGKGLSGVLVDLGLPVDWYRWISVCILFLIGSMSSQRTKQYWAILIPVFAAIFFWFGWFTGQSTLIGIVTLCAVLGVIVYMKSSLREKFGIGGPGTFILNLVAYLIILQACIGFINGLGVWDASTSVAIDSQYKNVEITQDIPNLTNAGGVLGDVMAISTILFDLAFTILRVLLSILGAIAFIYPTIAQMFPLVAASPQATAFLLLLQVGIWMTYAFFLYRLYKGDVGGVEL